MQQNGTLIVRVFVSRAQLPVSGATVIVAAAVPDGRHKILSIQITNESGVAGPISLETPGGSGLTPGGPSPFSSYTLIVEHPGYELALFDGLQVFPGVETVQEVPLIPVAAAETPDNWNIDTSVVTPQPL